MTAVMPVQEGLAPERLLAGWVETGAPAGFAEHVARYGPLPKVSTLIADVERAGLRGRGGAGFPTARKLAAVAGGRRGRRVVVANGCEGDPASHKDEVLLEIAPHLVVDGMVLAARAVGAAEAVLCVHAGSRAARQMPAVLRARPDRIAMQVVEVPARYVASEESALVALLGGGTAIPTVTPPRPAERGVRGRPTLVDNVETLAHLALVARYGPDWYRSMGTADSPGSTLVTVGGAVAWPGVYEVELGQPLGQVLDLAGGPQAPLQAVQVGGLGGSWLSFPAAAQVPFTHEDLSAAGGGMGVAALVALPEQACGVAETARVLHYLARESAGQCGPCMFGLPAVAADVALLAAGKERSALRRLRKRLPVVAGRGACAHPDGAVRFAASALRVFAADFEKHAAGRPCRWARASTWMPVGGRGR